MKFTCILSALMLACLLPRGAAGVPRPSSLTLRSGYVAYENLIGDTHPTSFTVSSSWDLGRQTAFWSSVGYVRESSSPYYIDPLRNSSGLSGSAIRTHLVPISAGFRGYVNGAQHHTRGLYFEIGPSVAAASYIEAGNTRHLAALGGFQGGMGVRFAGVDRSRFELGWSYQMAEALGRYPRALGRIGWPHEIDYHLVSVYLGVGFGN